MVLVIRDALRTATQSALTHALATPRAQITVLGAEEIAHDIERGALDTVRLETLLLEVLDETAGASAATPLIVTELADVFAERGSPDGALSIERVWSRVLDRRAAHVTCSYSLAQLAGDDREPFFDALRRAHERVEPASAPSDTPASAALRIAELERRVIALGGVLSPSEVTAGQGAGARAHEHAGAGLAHDLRNVLSAIALSATSIAGDAAPQHREVLEDIASFAELGATMSKQYATLEGGEPPRPAARCDAGSTLERLARILARVCAPRALTLDVAADLPAVALGSVELDRVVMNLVKNACEATPGSGRIVVRGRAEATHFELSVEDDGPGMSAATRSRALDPFFSTKSGRRERGLGLAIVRDIVEAAGGWVRIDAGRNRGTCVRVGLCWSVEPRRRVLVAGLTPRALGVATLALAAEGFEVVHTDDAEHAEALARGTTRLDALVTTSTFREHSGGEFANLVAGLRPRLAVVLVSGQGSIDTSHDSGVRRRGWARVMWPFSGPVIAATVTRVLDAASGEDGRS